MKKIIISILVCYGFSVYSQTGSVGINTANPDPSAVLELNSANKGLLIPRVSLQSLTDGTTVSSPAKGLFVYNTNTGLSNGEGFYVNYGTSASPNWQTFLPYSVNYVLDNAYSTTATNSVQYNFPVSGSTVNNVDLGLGLTVTVPAMSTVQIVVTYSTPMGFLKPTSSEIFGGYMGVRFLRNGVEAQGGSRKYSISQIFNQNNGSYVMTSVGATFVETVTNNTSTVGTVIYSLNGYIEKTQGTTAPTFIFNMFSATGSNFNWGRGTMSAQVFRKPL